MILKMQCSIDPPSWHYVDHIEDLHYDILQKKDGELQKKEEKSHSFSEILNDKIDYIDRMIVINDNHIDYHSIIVNRIDRLGQPTQEWYISDTEIYLLNDEGKTIECIRR